VKKSDYLVNADPKLIGDPARMEGPTVATLRRPSDFRRGAFRGRMSFSRRQLGEELFMCNRLSKFGRRHSASFASCALFFVEHDSAKLLALPTPPNLASAAIETLE
jgi:hypothetical protein